jgi:glycosyltransferase 2 family protein
VTQSLSKHPAVTALKWLLTAAAVFLVFRKISVPGIWPAVRSAEPWALAGSVAAILGASVLNAFRWKLLLRAPDLGIVKYLYFVFLGHFLNLFMPSSVASEALKVVAFGKRYGNLQRNIGVALVARGMGLLAQVVIGSISLALYYGELSRSGLFDRLRAPWLLLGAGALAILLGAAAAFRFRGRLARQTWIQAMLEVSRRKDLMAQTALVSIGIQILAALSGYLLFYSVFPGAPFGKVVLFILIIQAILMIPFSIGGVGVREYLSLLFFSDLGGMPKDAVFAANLLGYAPLVLLAAMGGAWMLFRRHGAALMAARKDPSAGDGE